MALSISLKPGAAPAHADELTCSLEGNLDNSTSPTLESRLTEGLAAKPRLLVFDLAKLKYVTSAGLRIFILAQKKQREHAGHVSFVNLQPQIKEVFAIMGSLPDVKIFQDQAELDAYLLARQRTYDK
jgi:anti-anti-sigma factor